MCKRQLSSLLSCWAGLGVWPANCPLAATGCHWQTSQPGAAGAGGVLTLSASLNKLHSNIDSSILASHRSPLTPSTKLTTATSRVEVAPRSIFLSRTERGKVLIGKKMFLRARNGRSRRCRFDVEFDLNFISSAVPYCGDLCSVIRLSKGVWECLVICCRSYIYICVWGLLRLAIPTSLEAAPPPPLDPRPFTLNV